MKLCQVCGATAPDAQATCLKCGEASWKPVPVARKAEPEQAEEPRRQSRKGKPRWQR